MKKNGLVSPFISLSVTAPVRISFAGGGTDVPDYFERHGGLVITSTITKYIKVTVKPNPHGNIDFQLPKINRAQRLNLHNILRAKGNCDIVKAALSEFKPVNGIILTVSAEAATVGLGLGSSSALAVATIQALSGWHSRLLTKKELARKAIKIEREVLQIPGGWQDQFAVTYGGFNAIQFSSKGKVSIEPLGVHPAVITALTKRLLLVFVSPKPPEAKQQKKLLERLKNNSSLTPFTQLKEVARYIKQALTKGNLDEFGLLLDRSWQLKKQTSPIITTKKIDRLYRKAQELGALGGKLLGSGSGGYLLLYCDLARRIEIAAALERLGSRIEPFSFTNQGVSRYDL